MKPYYQILIIVLFASCCKCSTHEIKRIDIASEGIIISIDSSLSYKCFQCNREIHSAYYKGQIDKATWDTLNQKVNTIKFDSLKSVDCSNEFDPGVEIMIKEDKGYKYFFK